MKEVCPLVFGFFVAALFPAMIAVYIFLKYFCMADSFDNRRHLQLACGLMIVSTITQYVGIVCGAIFYPDDVPTESIWIFFILNGLNTFNYIYFLIMAELWTAMHSGEATYLMQAQPTNAYNGNSSYMTGGPIGGFE